MENNIVALILLFVFITLLVVVYTFTSNLYIKNYDLNNFKGNILIVPIPIGAYSNYSLSDQEYPYGIINKSSIIPEKLDLYYPRRFLANSVWFNKEGYLKYELKNPLPKNSSLEALDILIKAAPGRNLDSFFNKTDVLIYVNNKRACNFTLNNKEGKMLEGSSIKPILIEVGKDGTYITYNFSLKNGKAKLRRISNTNIRDLNITKNLDIKISVDKDAKNKGGFSLFTEEFNNKKGLILMFKYKGEKIYQPSIADIINNPRAYKNKTVLLSVHPGGWACPPGKATQIPEGFSRSAIMIYDDTGCLYGNWDIISGKLLVPDLHYIYEPGNETIVVKGLIRLDKNGIPFISIK